MSRWLRVRGIVDRLVAAALACVAVPVVVVLAWVIRRHDGGPGVIAVPRCGRGGRPFDMYKLRTMRVDGSAGRASGPAVTVADDPRITPIGRRLRALRLDELPQLLNVVRGDMALIGPRPEAPDFVDATDRAWRQILVARPAIIGPTQFLVAGWEASLADADAYEREVLPVKKAVDAWYVTAASPRVDLAVLVAAVRQLLGRPQDRLRSRVLRDVPDVERIPA